MNSILIPFMYIAAIGVVLSVVVHISALLGMPSPFGEISWVLHMGIFVVWLPAILVANKLVRGFKQKDFWKAALRGCPQWMKNLIYLFLGYAILNFTIFAISDFAGGCSVMTGGDTPSNVFRGF
jgi:hypothetical protein